MERFEHTSKCFTVGGALAFRIENEFAIVLVFISVNGVCLTNLDLFNTMELFPSVVTTSRCRTQTAQQYSGKRFTVKVNAEPCANSGHGAQINKHLAQDILSALIRPIVPSGMESANRGNRKPVNRVGINHQSLAF